jgi:hypothetical protein
MHFFVDGRGGESKSQRSSSPQVLDMDKGGEPNRLY